jgi:VWFA-related protein
MRREADGQASERCNACRHILWDSTVAYHCLIAFIGLIVTPFVSGAQVSQSLRSEANDAYTLHVNANMVILSATVLDRHNALVSGLSKGDFQVYEDGVLQQIKDFSHDDIPVTAGILVDNSGSMAPKRDDVIAAALAFARASNPQDQMFVVNFNDRVSFGLPSDVPFTDRQDQLQRALSGIGAIGQTSLYDGIAAGLDHLKQGSRDRKVLIVISDGGDNASKHSLTRVIDMARHSTAIIYAIGIFDDQDGDQNPAVLKRFAKETGGEAFFPESSRDITSICEEIARDIRSQYTLTYVPANASQDGRYRTLDVRAGASGRGRLSVRTRTGYSVPVKIFESSSEGARP